MYFCKLCLKSIKLSYIIIVKFMQYAQKEKIMERELSRILLLVKEKTKIEIQAVSECGTYFASTKKEFSKVPPEYFSLQSDIIEEEGKTYFKFNFGGVKFIGFFDGCGDWEKKYAELIVGYLEFSQNKPDNLGFEEQLNLILTGNATKSKTAEFMNNNSLPKLPLFVMLIKTQDNQAEEIKEFLLDYFGGVDGAVTVSHNACAYIRYIDGEDVDSNSIVKQAEILKRSIFEELGADVAVFVGGSVKNFLDVSYSYEQALATEKAFELYGGSGGVYAYKDYLFNKIIVDLPFDRLEEYKNSLILDGKSEIFNDKELLLTGDYFLKNNLNLSETAREMYIHRNTLTYRLEKIERLTGLDIKKFSDAINFRLLYIISKEIK